MTVSVVIAAGGTGGHLVPALAIADAIRESEPDASIAFVGTARALDSDLVSRAGYRLHATGVRPFSRDIRGAMAPVALVAATARARAILREERADVVVGMGGYASVPVVAAARLARIPSVIHEANAIPGLANELAARLTPNVAVSFPEALHAFRRARLIGMPLRAAIARLDRDALRHEALATFGLDPDRRTVLVFGGSLGAARLNAAALDLVARWRDRADAQIVWGAGREHADRLAASVPDGALRVVVVPFIDRMELAYAAADVAVCRAGGSTVAELAAAGLPSILVPFPFARRREQHANARSLADAGGAIVLDDAHLSGERLGGLLEDLLADEARRDRMADAARRSARPDAAREMAAWVRRLARDAHG